MSVEIVMRRPNGWQRSLDELSVGKVEEMSRRRRNIEAVAWFHVDARIHALDCVLYESEVRATLSFWSFRWWCFSRLVDLLFIVVRVVQIVVCVVCCLMIRRWRWRWYFALIFFFLVTVFFLDFKWL